MAGGGKGHLLELEMLYCFQWKAIKKQKKQTKINK